MLKKLLAIATLITIGLSIIGLSASAYNEYNDWRYHGYNYDYPGNSYHDNYYTRDYYGNVYNYDPNSYYGYDTRYTSGYNGQYIWQDGYTVYRPSYFYDNDNSYGNYNYGRQDYQTGFQDGYYTGYYDGFYGNNYSYNTFDCDRYDYFNCEYYF